MSELPVGWAITKFGDVTENFDGQRIPVRSADRQSRQGQYPYYGASGVIDHVDGHIFDGSFLLVAEDGANLLARSTPIAFQAHGKFWVNNHAHIVRANAATTNAYLDHYLNSLDLAPFVTGSAQPKLTQKALNSIPLSLPPIGEQQRIVSKIQSLLSGSDRARRELDRVPMLIERYKRAFLSRAFSGELTAKWRARFEPPECGQRDYSLMGLDDQERGVWGSTLLPRGWQWRRFSDFFSDETDSARKLQQKAYEAEGLYPVIDQGEGFIGGYTSDESLVCAAEPPIVLFGDHTRCVKYIDFRFVQGADGTKVLKPVESVEPRYAYFALLALDLPDKGYSRHMKFLRASLFPCGSQEEQREVVRLIESAFSWLNRIAKEQARAVYQLPKLNRAILAKAFRGELVPQDPDDETASALLDRIRMEREGTVRSGRGRKRQNSR